MSVQNPENQLLSAQEVCAALDVSRRTLARRVKAGKFPPPARVEKGRPYWDRSVLSVAVAASTEAVPPNAYVIENQRIYAVRDGATDTLRRAS